MPKPFIILESHLSSSEENTPFNDDAMQHCIASSRQESASSFIPGAHALEMNQPSFEIDASECQTDTQIFSQLSTAFMFGFFSTAIPELIANVTYKATSSHQHALAMKQITNLLVLAFYFSSLDSQNSLIQSLIFNFSLVLLIQKAFLSVGLSEKASRILANTSSLCLTTNAPPTTTLAVAGISRAAASFGLWATDRASSLFRSQEEQYEDLESGLSIV